VGEQGQPRSVKVSEVPTALCCFWPPITHGVDDTPAREGKGDHRHAPSGQQDACWAGWTRVVDEARNIECKATTCAHILCGSARGCVCGWVWWWGVGAFTGWSTIGSYELADLPNDVYAWRSPPRTWNSLYTMYIAHGLSRRPMMFMAIPNLITPG
jgi:hypothetical protein